jgi:hypothetical protein
MQHQNILKAFLSNHFPELNLKIGDVLVIAKIQNFLRTIQQTEKLSKWWIHPNRHHSLRSTRANISHNPLSKI